MTNPRLQIFKCASLAALFSSVPSLAYAANACIAGNFISNLETLSFRPPLQLSANDIPRYVLRGLIPDLFPKALEAKRVDLLEAFLAEPGVTIQLEKDAKSDRYNRKPAFIARSSKKGQKVTDQVLLQETLIKRGLARLDPTQLVPDCADHLLALEQIAQETKTGLWKLKQFRVKSASDPALAATISTYQIVKGRPLSINRQESRTSYLNFGRNWNTDFTATLSKKNLANWEAQNNSLDDLKDRTIYVRGWIEDHGGPLIRVQHPKQIGILPSPD